MIDKSSLRPVDRPAAPGAPMMLKSAPDPLAFPQTLTGTLQPPTSGLSKDNALQQVAALQAVNATLTSVCQDVAKSMQPSDSEPARNFLFEQGDSQGRMDLITRLTGKLKDIVNPVIASLRPLTGTLSRSRP